MDFGRTQKKPWGDPLGWGVTDLKKKPGPRVHGFKINQLFKYTTYWLDRLY